VIQRKGNPEKVKMALRLGRENAMTLKWIAQQLHRGSRTHRRLRDICWSAESFDFYHLQFYCIFNLQRISSPPVLHASCRGDVFYGFVGSQH
jgi:hypothetical protein